MIYSEAVQSIRSLPVEESDRSFWQCRGDTKEENKGYSCVPRWRKQFTERQCRYCRRDLSFLAIRPAGAGATSSSSQQSSTASTVNSSPVETTVLLPAELDDRTSDTPSSRHAPPPPPNTPVPMVSKQ